MPRFPAATRANDDFDSSAIIKQLYPDQETYKKQEQRRFEILGAHWDLPIKDVDHDTRWKIYSGALRSLCKTSQVIPSFRGA